MRQPLALDQQAPAAEFDQFAAQLVAQRPDLLVGNEVRVGHSLPEFRRIDLIVPIRPLSATNQPAPLLPVELAPPESAHRPFHPAQQMNAIGDMADRHLLDRLVRDKGDCHMWRLTRPCSSLTPLAARESFSASTVMQNGSLFVLRVQRGPAPSAPRTELAAARGTGASHNPSSSRLNRSWPLPPACGW